MRSDNAEGDVNGCTHNHRRELFAQLLFQGYSAVKAYEKAGYKRHDGNACTLAKHPEVQARLEEIRDGTGSSGAGFPVGTIAIAARANITVESLIEWQNEIRQRGLESGQLFAAVNATKEISVLTGHRVERREVGAPGEYDHLSDDELLAALRDRIERLGLTPDLPKTKTQH